jgi:2-hydroxychromene-2-carboxylate isomerase
MGDRKKANYIADLLHWAELSGVAMHPRSRDLIKSDSRPALLACMAAAELGRFSGFHHAAYRARWSEARDLSQREVLAELLENAGLDAEAALKLADSAELSDRLDQQTQGAIERGVFGVPTIFVGDEMFWGNDRFELVRFFLEKAGAA